MLDVVTASFYIKAADFERQDFERYSTELFDQWDAEVESHLSLPDYSLSLVIEEGSIRGIGEIAAGAAALYFAIGNYGSFISGLQTIGRQASYVANALFSRAKHDFGCKSTRGNYKKSGGEILYLKSLFERVQRGKITPDRAVDEVRIRWGAEATSSPKFLQDLAVSLSEAPRHPKQLTLSDESWEACPKSVVPSEREPRLQLTPSPQPPIPQHYRIEISRPSRRDKKKVKLTELK